MHFGSLVAAVGSYLEAKQAAGKWLLRIEDLDPPREMPGAADLILQTLERFGFEWDEAVLYQSSRLDAYEQALERLRERRLIYPCSCSRSDILQSQTALEDSSEELRYPGFCRLQPRRSEGPFAIRFRVPSQPIQFHDDLQGEFSVELSSHIGDFVVKRRDGFFAYQLAVVVDDNEQGITHVVRGADLLSNTPRQIALQQALHLPPLHYSHLPLAVDADRKKLSKASGAAALDLERPAHALWQALVFLRQAPPPALAKAPLSETWAWARAHWTLQPLAGLRHIAVS